MDAFVQGSSVGNRSVTPVGAPTIIISHDTPMSRNMHPEYALLSEEQRPVRRKKTTTNFSMFYVLVSPASRGLWGPYLRQ
jgi:hypothetical protein